MSPAGIQLIGQKYRALKEKIPKRIWSHLLLTGGTAAFLFGSDRPFSDDLDFMVPEKFQPELEKILGIKFAVNSKKPVFHSLAGHFSDDWINYDLIAKSTIQPANSDASFSFEMTKEIEKRRVAVPFKKDVFFCAPRELLVIMKLLAGRGEELNKYDLYDVHCVLTRTGEFDVDFFGKLILDFCQPLSASVPVLLRNAEKTALQYKTPMDSIVSVLKRMKR